MLIGHKNILIVDDDLTNRLVLRSLIADLGYESVEVENGEEAVAAVKEHRVDIILMDVMMPVMNGYEAAKIIKSHQTRFIPIIFLTAMTDEASLAKCIEAGGDDFLTKPYNHVLLTSKINSMLRIASLYSKIEDKNKKIQDINLQMQQEMLVTKKLFDKITKNDIRGEKTGLNFVMSPMSMFNGDIILAEENQTTGLDILIGDFTGHGLSAAIGAIPVSDIFHAMTQKCFTFVDLLQEINVKLLDLLPVQMFMACALISIDRSNNVLSVINCGLPDIYLYRDNKIIHTFHSKNIPLGINQISASQFEVEMLPVQYGDSIFAATDGVMEATSSTGEMFGLKRILKLFNSGHESSLLFNKLLSEVTDHCVGAAQSDDTTFLELSHLKEVEYPYDNSSRDSCTEPSKWAMQFTIDVAGLSQFDILPYVMQGINQLQPLECGRTSMLTVLSEMFTNALDHGLLRLDSSMKNTPQGYTAYYQEKQRRLDALKEGFLQISLSHELNDKGGGRLILHIIDSGEGFDYKPASEAETNQLYGRGLKLISSLCDDFRVIGKGNAAMAYYEWDKHN